MAIASKLRYTSPSSVPRQFAAGGNPILRAVDEVYRFLASLKLAVICLTTLALVLAAATYIESRYGTSAVQDWVYQSWWFRVLLAFLGTNILCAALIRFPWTQRQTGFVITHAGLLVVLAGAFWSFMYADEGQVALTEGTKTEELIRPDRPVIRVREVDARTFKPVSDEYFQLPLRPGPLPWAEGQYEVLSDAKTPFRLAVKNHLPASRGVYVHEKARDGMPMIKVAVLAQAPNMLHANDLFADDSTDSLRWLVAENRIYRAVRNAGPVTIAFQYLDTDDKLQAFLNPPTEMGSEGAAVITYTDRSGKTRRETVAVDPAEMDKPRPLPDSDITIRLADIAPLPESTGHGALGGEGPLVVVAFKVKKGDGPEVTHFGMDSLPMAPSVMPGMSGGGEESRELVHVDYLRPLRAGRSMGRIEVAGMPDGRLYYRAFNRSGLKGSGKVELGKPVQALGGGGMPMSITLRVDDYITSGRERLTFRQADLEVGKLNEGIPAALVELSADGETKEFWLRRSGGYDPEYKHVVLPNGKAFEVAYDIDRAPLGFEIALDDFEMGIDPGTSKAASFKSKIRLTDEARGIRDKPVEIWMNHTMDHAGWTFYQANYVPLEDPETREKTGEYMSVFQVGHDPGRPLKYLGCLLVVLGTFVQFYMRAGLFSDGGKKERERAAARAAQRARKTEHEQTTDEPDAGSEEPL